MGPHWPSMKQHYSVKTSYQVCIFSSFELRCYRFCQRTPREILRRNKWKQVCPITLLPSPFLIFGELSNEIIETWKDRVSWCKQTPEGSTIHDWHEPVAHHSTADGHRPTDKQTYRQTDIHGSVPTYVFGSRSSMDRNSSSRISESTESASSSRSSLSSLSQRQCPSCWLTLKPIETPQQLSRCVIPERWRRPFLWWR